jgi:hypothetical protein
MLNTMWTAVANGIAKDGHENHSHHYWRWATFESHHLYFCDNHPFPEDAKLRGRFHDLIAAGLKAHGCALVATASYPEAGARAGHTRVLMFQRSGSTSLESAVQLAERLERRIFLELVLGTRGGRSCSTR